jgi:cytosine/adenosine deaminase-related metal-dependent hydrolase
MQCVGLMQTGKNRRVSQMAGKIGDPGASAGAAVIDMSAEERTPLKQGENGPQRILVVGAGAAGACVVFILICFGFHLVS